MSSQHSTTDNTISSLPTFEKIEALKEDNQKIGNLGSRREEIEAETRSLSSRSIQALAQGDNDLLTKCKPILRSCRTSRWTWERSPSVLEPISKSLQGSLQKLQPIAESFQGSLQKLALRTPQLGLASESACNGASATGPDQPE